MTSSTFPPRSDTGTATKTRDRRSHLPARTRKLMEDLHALARKRLQASVHTLLDTFADTLFDLATSARNGLDQQAIMNSRDRLLHARPLVEQKFMDRIDHALDRMGKPPSRIQQENANQPLSLVNPDTHEVAAVLEKVAARGVARGGPALFELGYRLAVLVGSPPLEDKALPLGPHALATAFHEATALLDLPREHQVLLLDSLDKSLTQSIGPLAEAANAHLIASGILPRLQPYKVPADPKRQDRNPIASEFRSGQHAPDARRRSAPGQSSDYPAEPSRDGPMAVLENLRELLAQQRGHARNDHSSENIVSPTQLQEALGALQQHSGELIERTGRELLSASRLRKEILAQLEQTRPTDAPPALLGSEQDTTIELVAMLFEQMGRQVPHDGKAYDALSGLQLPILRLALEDRSLFEQQEHPARQLVNKITEAADNWLDHAENGPDRELAVKLETLIERARREPPSAGLYTSLLADIEHHLDLLKLRAEVAERRHVKSMQGRERLERARLRARELVAERCAKAPPRGLLRVLLELAWTDVLALTLLNYSEHDLACITQLTITDKLLGLIPVSDRKQLKREVQTGLCQIGMAEEEANQVAQRLVEPQENAPRESGTPSTTELLVRLKKHQRLGDAPKAEVVEPTAPAPSESASTPSVKKSDHPEKTSSAPAATSRPTPARNHAKPAVSVDTTSENPPAPTEPRSARHSNRAPAAAEPVVPAVDASVPIVLNERERSLRRELDKLAFGTWFLFTDPANGQVRRHKLAWHSPMSGQALFVNRQGQRVRVLRLDELARQMADGSAREMSEETESTFDRAWHNVTANLQRAVKSSRPREARPS